MEMDKGKKLRPCQIGESIAFMPFDKFFDYLSCMEKDVVW